MKLSYCCGVTTWTQTRIVAYEVPEKAVDWPPYLPTSSARNQVLTSCPGRASTCPPSVGMNQRCVTSVDVRWSRTVVSTGTVSSPYEKTRLPGAPPGYSKRHNQRCPMTLMFSTLEPLGMLSPLTWATRSL